MLLSLVQPRRSNLAGVFLCLLLAGAIGAAHAQAVTNESAVARYPLKNAYFGELHIHTPYSLDAYIFGNTMNDPFTAYRFAKGEKVTLPTGVEKRIVRPLDFAAVTDHAEALGKYEICTNPDFDGYQSGKFTAFVAFEFSANTPEGPAV